MQYLSQQELKPPENWAVVSQLISQSVSLPTAGGRAAFRAQESTLVSDHL